MVSKDTVSEWLYRFKGSGRQSPTRGRQAGTESIRLGVPHSVPSSRAPGRHERSCVSTAGHTHNNGVRERSVQAPHAPADAAQQGKSMPMQRLGAALPAGGSEWGACVGMSHSSRLRTSEGRQHSQCMAVRVQRRYAARHAPTIPASCERCHKWRGCLACMHACVRAREHGLPRMDASMPHRPCIPCNRTLEPCMRESAQAAASMHAAADAPTHRGDRRARGQDAGARTDVRWSSCCSCGSTSGTEKPASSCGIQSSGSKHMCFALREPCARVQLPRSCCSGHHRSLRAPRQLLPKFTVAV